MPSAEAIDRRRFLQLATAGLLLPVAAGVLSACGDGGTGPAAAASPSKKKSTRKVKIGFIALTDCASVVMAQKLGYFAERDLDVTLEKQASWPATRDNLLHGEIDAAHALFSLPLSVASGLTGSGTALKVAMILNNNGQAITLHKDLAAAGYANLDAAREVLEKKTPTLAMTYPGGTHDLWLRYWLRATKADTSDIKIIPIPPPQMVANMKVGAMDGYCVGEPWNAVAVQQQIGFTHLTSQDLWKHHPEKALVASETFAANKNEALSDVMGAVLKAGKWLDDPTHRAEAATTLGEPAFVNAPPAEIAPRLLGNYDLGVGLPAKTYTGDQMMFFRGGKVNAPRRAHALWVFAQYQRLGLVKDAPPAQQLADQIFLRDLYEKVAADEGIDVPDDDMAPFDVALDGARFDPRKLSEEVSRP
jgi:nitrate/nitrite transport system substrate-binding protein